LNNIDVKSNTFAGEGFAIRSTAGVKHGHSMNRQSNTHISL